MSASSDRSDTPSLHDTAIDEALTTFFERKSAQAEQIHVRYKTLWDELARVTLNGGKRLRPKMTLLAYEACGGSDTNAIVPIAAAQEVLHASLLIHDDIIDRETQRRGGLNVTGVYEKEQYRSVQDAHERRHYSDSAALLGGDLLLASIFDMLRSSNISLEQREAVETIFHRMIFEVAGGQLLDVEAAFRNDSASAETIARYKTASYSFIGPLLIGATLAHAEHSALDYIEQYAIALGIAYQLNDDLLGTFGDIAITGKSSEGDLREGKVTYLIEYFFAHATQSEIDAFTGLFGKSTISNEQVDSLKLLLTNCGAVNQTEALIEQYIVQAHSALDKLTLPATAVNQFKGLIELSTKRRK